MKSVQILGMAVDSICILADIIEELGLGNHLKIYMNIEFNKKPITPITPFAYDIFPPSIGPDSEEMVIFGTSGPKNKLEIYNYYHQFFKIQEKNYLKIIHPSSYIAPSSHIADGILVEPNVTISSQTEVGFGVTIKRSCSIGHHNRIGAYSDINPGVIISGNVEVGRGCILGSGTIIRNDIKIGENSYIGMGSVVTKDIPPHSIAYGNPCKVISPNNKWAI